MSAWNVDEGVGGRVAGAAMSRLASALVTAEDAFEGAAESCSLEAVVRRLSARDRVVLASIARRVAEIEAERGSQAAEIALARVVSILAGDRRTV